MSITGFNEWNNSIKEKGGKTMKNNEQILKLEHDLRVQEWQNEKNKGNIDYVAMMTDVELPEDEEQEVEENE